ncbi:hypothetical protein LXL04_017982 [Taraxacum kok-saghyz]
MEKVELGGSFWSQEISEIEDLRINMFHIQKKKLVFIKSGRHWRQEESGSYNKEFYKCWKL